MLAYLSAHRRDLPVFVPESFRSKLLVIEESRLSDTDGRAIKALLVGFMVDQKLFARSSSWIEDFLLHGGTLVFNGHIAYPFLPFLRRFIPLPKRGKEDLLISPINEHPVFAGVDYRDLTERRGVRGFYGRGANPMPDDATAINRVGKDAVIDWQLNVGKGRLLMHSGINLWLYHQDDSTAARITPQLLSWCLGEVV